MGSASWRKPAIQELLASCRGQRVPGNFLSTLFGALRPQGRRSVWSNMKPHLALLVLVHEIAPILALRTITDDEPSFESNESAPALNVAVAVPGHTVITADGHPCVESVRADDKITLLMRSPPASLSTVLRAAGIDPSRDRETVDLEEFHHRVLSIDAAWVLLRRLRLTQSDEEAAQEAAANLLQLGWQWHLLRVELLDKGDSPARTARQRELEAAAARLVPTIRGLSLLELEPDPRGSALSLQFEGQHRQWLGALQFNWAVPLARTATPRRGHAAGDRFAPRPTRLRADVLGALNACITDGHEVRITERLAPRLYQQVNEVLSTLGGSWHTGRQAHVFAEPPGPRLLQVIQTSEIFTARDFEFFETPAALVERVIRKARIERGMLVGEPNAGQGALALAAAEIVGIENVHCHELMPANVLHLQRLGFNVQAPVDFLGTQPRPVLDRVVMNPPFSGGRDMQHVLHASKWLKPGGRLVSITSTQWRDRETAAAGAFREFLDRHNADIDDIPSGAFRQSGTDVPTLLVTFDQPSHHLRQTPVTQFVPSPGPQQLAFF